MNEVKEINPKSTPDEIDEEIIQDEKNIQNEDIAQDEKSIKETDQNSFSMVEMKNEEENESENKPLKFIKTMLQSIFQTRAFVVLVGVVLLLKTLLLYKMAIF